MSPERPARILHVEDQLDFQEIIHAAVAECPVLRVELAITIAQAVLMIVGAKVARSPYDVILLDLCLPDSPPDLPFIERAIYAIKCIRAVTQQPIVVLTGMNTDMNDLDAECRRAGANGVLMKTEPLPSITTAIMAACAKRLAEIHIEREASRYVALSLTVEAEIHQSAIDSWDDILSDVRDSEERLQLAGAWISEGRAHAQ